MMRIAILCGTLLGGLLASGSAFAAASEQSVNVTAIAMFGLFVLLTLGITYWAAGRTRSTADFYTAGGGITGTQNGFAIAGDYMSAATLLGMSSLVFFKGYDGLVYLVSGSSAGRSSCS